MKDRKLTIPTFLYLILFALCIVGIILGSFYDLPINNAIAAKLGDNPYGAFFETIGIIPSYLTIGLAGGMIGFGVISKAREQEQKPLRIGLIAIGAVILVGALIGGTIFLGGQLSTGDPYDRYGIRLPSRVASLIISFALQALMYVFVFFCLDRKKADKLIKIGAIIAFGIMVQWICLHFLKQLGGRPRYRFLFGEDNGIFEGVKYTYQEWFQFSPNNPHMEYFKSWPSGHSASIAVILGVAYLPLVSKWRFKHDVIIIFIVASIYAFNVFFSRMLAGAHFLSDVSFGGLIGFFLIFIASFLIEKLLPYKEPPAVEDADE